MTIELPNYIFEKEFYPFLQLLSNHPDKGEVILDFGNIKFWIPASIVALISKIKFWKTEGYEVILVNHTDFEAFEYFQRINFFNYCNIDLEENFERHDPGDRFVPINGIGSLEGYTLKTDDLATNIADCLAPEQSRYIENVDIVDNPNPNKFGLHSYIEYSVSELARNVKDHSNSVGFIASQYNAKYDIVRLAIADFGIGIRNSFKNTAHWDDSLNDLDAIKLALKPEISSKNSPMAWGESNNMGMGLTFLQSLSRKVEGDFSLVSYRGYLDLVKKKHLNADSEFVGTLCSLSFKRDLANNYSDLLSSIKEDLGIKKPKRDIEINFS